MDAENKTVVRIAGRDYYVKSNESDEYIQKLALYIDKKLRKILDSSNKLSTSMAAVLVALNVADDYFKLKDQDDNLQEELQELKEKVIVLENEKNKLQNDKDRLDNEKDELKLRLVKRETELKEIRNSYNKLEKQSSVKR